MTKLRELGQRIWETHRTLILWLTLPLLTASALCLLLSRPFTARDVLLNLASDFLTIVVTIWYVDWVLRSHEERKWEEADRFISAEVGKVAHGFISEVVERSGLGNKVFSVKEPPLHTRTIQDIQNEIIMKVKSLNREEIIDHLKPMNATQWENLMDAVREKSRETSSLLTQFGSRMSSSEMESILRFREAASTTLTSYSLFKPLLGVPLHMLPKVDDDKAWEYTIIQTIRSGMDLDIALKSAVEVIETFRYEAPDLGTDYFEEMEKRWNQWWE